MGEHRPSKGTLLDITRRRRRPKQRASRSSPPSTVLCLDLSINITKFAEKIPCAERIKRGNICCVRGTQVSRTWIFWTWAPLTSVGVCKTTLFQISSQRSGSSLIYAPQKHSPHQQRPFRRARRSAQGSPTAAEARKIPCNDCGDCWELVMGHNLGVDAFYAQ